MRWDRKTADHGKFPVDAVVIPLPSGPLPFDTSICIRYSRGEDYVWLGEDTQILHRTILTAVVAAELYGGTHNHRERRALDELWRAHRARTPYPWATSPRRLQPHGLIVAFCYVATVKMLAGLALLLRERSLGAYPRPS